MDQLLTYSISKFYIVHLSFTSEEVKKEILNIALALIELDRSYTIPTGSIRKSSFFLADDENGMIEIITTVSNLHDFLSR